MAVEVGDWVKVGGLYEGEVIEERGDQVRVQLPSDQVIRTNKANVRAATKPQTGLKGRK